MLFPTLVEAPESVEDGCQRSLRGKVAILLQGVDQPLFTEFFVGIVTGFGHTVGE